MDDPIVLAGLMFAAALSAVPGIVPAVGNDPVPEVSVKAALIYNFAKFVEWPALPAGAPIAFCFVGDARIAVAFSETIQNQRIGGHMLNVTRPQDDASWRGCNVLFISGPEAAESAAGLDAVRTLPVLTVSDGTGFVLEGIIELYPENGRMHFSINVDAAERSGLRVSSRLLGLARVVRSPHVQ